MATLTFLNTTGSPGLSRDMAKRMRGHITRVNFAKRRERTSTRTKGPERGNESAGEAAASDSQGSLTSKGLAELLSRSDPRLTLSTFSQIWELMFMHRSAHRGDADAEAAWLGLLLSDPALLDATLAVGMRHWSPEPGWKWNAGIHQHRAVRSMIERIGSGTASTDGALGAALTMAFGERLMGNDGEWSVHVDGVAQLIRERRSQGISREPPWFFSLMVCDSINYALGYPRMYHRKIIDALDPAENQTLIRMASIIDKVVTVRKIINTCPDDGLGPELVLDEVSRRVREVHDEAEAFQVSGDEEVIGASLSIQLLLYLSWPYSSPADLTPIAGRLKAALRSRRISQCSYMDMTSCQLLLGAKAASRGSETKAWFANKLTSAVTATRSRGWIRPVVFLEEGLVVDETLMEPLSTLTGRLGHERQHLLLSSSRELA